MYNMARTVVNISVSLPIPVFDFLQEEQIRVMKEKRKPFSFSNSITMMVEELQQLREMDTSGSEVQDD